MIVIILCLLIATTQAVRNEKCSKKCKDGTFHTYCYPAGGGDDCKNNKNVYLTASEKRMIVEVHNNIRNSVGSGNKSLGTASSMMKLVWKREVRNLAKRWADQCEEGLHDECRTTSDGEPTGQNSYVGTYTRKWATAQQKVSARFDRIKKIINETWFNELKLLTKSDINKFDESKIEQIGNVTQMIWADTTYIGCAYTEFALKTGNILFRFICDYEPIGNIPSRSVFVKGKPCSRCPKGSSCSESYSCICFNGENNDFVEDSEAFINLKPSLYVITLSCLLVQLRGIISVGF